MVFLIEGQKKAKKEKTNRPRAFQEAGLKILFHLLSNPEHLQDSYRTIADKADVSLGSVSHVMAELEDLNFLLKTKDKRILKNKMELLERWIMEYNTILRPRIVRKRMRFSIQMIYAIGATYIHILTEGSFFGEANLAAHYLLKI